MEVLLPAIDVRNVHKSYNKKTLVLQDTSLLVKKGNIYGLLGPSGCGKTTLLKLVIGRLKPNSGKVRVLGYQPGTIESKIPGSRIGYMPQELALFQEFTVSETLHFFGRIHNMSRKQIKDRQTFLLSFLDLPSASRKISQLSGGQQRRVSLAVALLHSPEILILDEPTVGVDPLLRQRIWEHLVGISTANNTTIIITTHYIEEARSANCVGLMRNGRILAEGSPDLLLERYNKPSLEEVFLHLCLKDDNMSGGSMHRGKATSEEKQSLVSNEATPDVVVVDPSLDRSYGQYDDDVTLLNPNSTSSPPLNTPTNDVSIVSYDEMEGSCSDNFKHCCSSFPKPRNILALVIKNGHMMRKNVGFLLFQFLLPAIQITLFAFCIGDIHSSISVTGSELKTQAGTPKGLNVQIANEDVGLTVGPFSLSVSDIFISQLDSEVMSKGYVDSIDIGKEYIRNGTSWALLSFPENFTRDTFQRMQNSSNTDPALVKGSTIQIWMDETNQQISMTLKGKIIEAYQDLPAAIVKKVKDKYNRSLPFNVSSAELPVHYNKPIFGKDSETFLDFVAPGIMCSIIYFLAVGLTALSLVMEIKEGLFERSLVSGVTVLEIMLGHIGNQFVVMLIQTAVLIVFAFAVFNVYTVGSILVIILFELLIGFTGMSLGFVISTAAQNEQSATQLSLAVVFPFLLISGILWPIEAMPQWLQYISICLPLTLAVEGQRAVVGRGWDLTYYVVYRGYLVAAGWAIGFLLLALIISKIRHSP